MTVKSPLAEALAGLADKRLAVAALVALLLVLAAVESTRMPLELLPEVRYPQVRVISDLPGQTSVVIEESINEPLEAALTGMAGLVRMESRSGDGRSYLDLFFQPGYDMERALRDVSQGVQQATAAMPDRFPAPRIFEVTTAEEPALQFAFGSPVHTPAELRQILRSQVMPQLRTVAGVDSIFIGREEDPELRVDIDPMQQIASGVSLEAVEQLLLEAVEPAAAGLIRTPGFEGVGVLDEARWDADELMQRTLIAGGENGEPITLGHIATIYRAPSETSLRTRLNGESAVLVTVYRAQGARALRMAREVREAVADAMQQPALNEVESTLLFDDSVTTRGAVQSVLTAALAGSVLAMGLVWLALVRGRQIGLVGLVVVSGLSAAVLSLSAFGLSLNLLTLAGLLISVGLGLDYAIVYFDRLERLQGEVDMPVVQAMRDVAAPLFGALLTTVAAVSPFLLVQGLVAELFRPLILTVIFSSVFAFLAAAMILPTFATARIDAVTSSASRAWTGRTWRFSQRPWVIWPAAGLLLFGLVLLGRAVPFEVLPSVDDGFVDVRIVHPAGISAEAMNDIAREAEGALMGVDGTAELFTTVGGYFREGLPAFRPATANFMVRVDTAAGDRPSADWADDARAAISELDIVGLSTRIDLPRIRGVQTRLSDADIEVILTHRDGDLLQLIDVESQVEQALEQVDGLTDVERLRSGVSPRWQIVPDHAALSHYGVRNDDLRRTVNYTMEGTVLAERMERGDPLSLRVRYGRDRAGGPQHFEQIVLPAASGTAWIHLADVAEFRLIEEPTHIERRENQRVVRIGAQLDGEGAGPAATADAVQSALRDLALPDSVSWWLEGEIESLEETRQTFGLALALALFVVLIILIVQYGALTWALAAWLSIPLCALGAISLLWLIGRPLDAMVLAGMLISVGIVANSMILVLSEARWRLHDSDKSLEEALAEASRSRLRPITLTVTSTVLGMSPLLFGGSEVFGLLQPLAIALTGTLLLSIPVACLMLPGLLRSLAGRTFRQSM